MRIVNWNHLYVKLKAMFINSYISIEELGFSENVKSKFRIIAIQHNLINKASLMDTDSNPSSILATIYYNVLTIYLLIYLMHLSKNLSPIRPL